MKTLHYLHLMEQILVQHFRPGQFAFPGSRRLLKSSCGRIYSFQSVAFLTTDLRSMLLKHEDSASFSRLSTGIVRLETEEDTSGRLRSVISSKSVF